MKKILLILPLIALSLFSYAQTKTIPFTATGTTDLATTFMVPAGVPSVTISAWGGGGGGGGAAISGLTLDVQRGGGGGGGAFAGGIYAISSGVSLSITAGGAGAGGLLGGAGAAGKASIVQGLVSAAGGGGGFGNSSGGIVSGGTGGIGSQLVNNGGTGGNGTSGIAGVLAVSGSGGSGGNGGGAGGIGINALLGSFAGNPGDIPGGGGSGARNLLAGTFSGGTGGAGKVILSYNCPIYSLTSTTASIVDLCIGTSSTITLNGLPAGLYSVGYELNNVAQIPVSMTVNATGSGSFIVSGFTTLGTKSLAIKSLTSGTSANAADNCSTTNISLNNTVTVSTISSGTAPVALAGTGATCTQITANWQAVSGATYYELDVATDISFTNFVSGYNALNVLNTLTRNVTGLSNSTNYYYRVRAFKGTCISANSTVITYKTAVVPNSVQLVGATNIGCQVFTANWNVEPNALTYEVQISTDAAFPSTAVTQTFTGITALSYVFSGLATGTTYYYRVLAKNGCGVSAYGASSTSSIKTIDLPSMPQSESLILPSCLSPTGSVVLKGLPNRNDYQIIQSGTYPATYTGGKGSDLTKFTVTGLAPGSYNFVVEFPGSCPSQPLQNVIISPLITNTYTISGGWSNGTPTENQNIVFADDFSSSSDLTSCTCKVNAGKQVIINSLNTLNIQKDLVVDPAQGTSLKFKNNSSLVQVSSTAINSGNITYERSTTPILRKDYVYWSTPVNPQTLGALSPSSSLMYSNDGTQWVAASKTSNMIVGSGYIVRAPDNYSFSTKQVFPAVFTGVPNNGDIVGEPLLADRSYVIGNPYPCALSADMLLEANKMLDGTIYFWTHNTPQNLGAVSQYTPDDYAAYNTSGGVATSAKSDPLHSDNPANDNGKKPTGKIAAGQGFYVGTNLSGNVKFTNLMRLGASDNTQFFKPGAAGAIEKNRIWLNMTNTDGVFKQLLVSYIEGATNDYENRYDGLSFNANPYLDFYSVGNNVNYVIQGRALPFVDTDIVPLGYETTIKGEFTISIDEVDGKMSNQAIYLEDKMTGEIHDLRTSDYTFKTEIGTFVDRLVLRYTGRSLGTGDFENLENGILVSVKNKVINVLSSKENIKEVTIFDVSGKLVYNKKKVGNTELQIPNLPLGDQVLLVKVTLENDFTTTKKIVF